MTDPSRPGSPLPLAGWGREADRRGSPLPLAGEVGSRSDPGEGTPRHTLTRRATRGDLSRDAGEVDGRGADSTQRGSALAIAQHLAAVLAAENAALAALDLPGAAAMLGAKHRAVEAFAELPPEPGAGQGNATHRTQWTAIGRQLIDLAAENRALLERAIAVQARVLGVIAQAGRRESAARPTGYGACGRPRAAPRPVAVAFSARA